MALTFILSQLPSTDTRSCLEKAVLEVIRLARNSTAAGKDIFLLARTNGSCVQAMMDNYFREALNAITRENNGAARLNVIAAGDAIRQPWIEFLQELAARNGGIFRVAPR